MNSLNSQLSALSHQPTALLQTAKASSARRIRHGLLLKTDVPCASANRGKAALTRDHQNTLRPQRQNWNLEGERRLITALLDKTASPSRKLNRWERNAAM